MKGHAKAVASLKCHLSPLDDNKEDTNQLAKKSAKHMLEGMGTETDTKPAAKEEKQPGCIHLLVLFHCMQVTCSK